MGQMEIVPRIISGVVDDDSLTISELSLKTTKKVPSQRQIEDQKVADFVMSKPFKIEIAVESNPVKGIYTLHNETLMNPKSLEIEEIEDVDMDIDMPVEEYTLEEKIDIFLEKFEALLNDPDMDLSKMLHEVQKIVTYLMHASGKLDKAMKNDYEDEIWLRVAEVKDTFNSKTSLIIACVSAGLTILSGVGGIASVALPSTGIALFSGVDAGKNIKTVSDGIGQFGQGTGMFSKMSDESSQGLRTVAQAYLEAARQKHGENKESLQRHLQQVDRALQLLRDLLEKDHRAMEMLQRER